MRHAIVALLSLAVAACQSTTGGPTVALASPGLNAAGKQFNPPPEGTGALYFYNPTTVSPVLNVRVDGLELGHLGARTWMRVDVFGGHHVLRCRGADSANGLWVKVAPGDLRFFDVQMRSGEPVCSIRETSAGVGRASVLNGNRALQNQ
jgi:hypothetical protein